MLANQIHGQLDLIFPGLTGCFAHGLDEASLRVLIRDLPDPHRVSSSGRGRGAALRSSPRRAHDPPQAEQVVQAAQGALRLPSTERRAPLVVSLQELRLCWRALGPDGDPDAPPPLQALLYKTPAGVLLSAFPMSASRRQQYGAAIGDPNRYSDAAAAWAPALVDELLEWLAGPAGIRSEGSVEFPPGPWLSSGRGLGLHHPSHHLEAPAGPRQAPLWP